MLQKQHSVLSVAPRRIFICFSIRKQWWWEEEKGNCLYRTCRRITRDNRAQNILKKSCVFLRRKKRTASALPVQREWPFRSSFCNGIASSHPSEPDQRSVHCSVILLTKSKFRFVKSKPPTIWETVMQHEVTSIPCQPTLKFKNPPKSDKLVVRQMHQQALVSLNTARHCFRLQAVSFPSYLWLMYSGLLLKSAFVWDIIMLK